MAISGEKRGIDEAGPNAPPSAGQEAQGLHDLFCLQCGYDLWGIREDRCPECGFGFQRAAIRAVAIAQAEALRGLLRRLVVLGFLGTLCALVQAIHGVWQTTGGLVLITVFHTVFFAVWLSIGRAPVLLQVFISRWKFTLALMAAPLVVGVGIAFPWVFSVLALAMLALAGLAIVQSPAGFRYARLSLPPEYARKLRRWHVLACATLGTAGVALLAALLAQ